MFKEKVKGWGGVVGIQEDFGRAYSREVTVDVVWAPIDLGELLLLPQCQTLRKRHLKVQI